MSAAEVRPIVRRQWKEVDRWRANLRGRGGGVEVAAGDGVSVRVTAEPLIRVAADGTELQPVRVTVTGSGSGSGSLAPERVEVIGADGVALVGNVEAAPGGSVRVLVPAVARATQCRVVASLSAGRGQAEASIELPVVRRWTVHLIHHSHLDIGYTDPQPIVLANQASFLDTALDLVAATDDRADDARFRWCAESLWPVQRWAESRPPARVEAFAQRVREGRIELSALPFNLHTEACSTTELFELLRGAQDVAAAWGVPLVSAMQTDVPGAVGALPDALGEAGVRYLAVAHNWAGRSVPHLSGGPGVPRLFRWRGPAGHEVLVWRTDTPSGLAYAEGALVGFAESVDVVDDLLPAYLGAIATSPFPYGGEMMGLALADAATGGDAYPFDLLHLRVIGKLADNTAPSRVVADIVRDWAARWAWPRLRLSTNTDFFTAAEATLGDRIPTFEGDWNDWWSDGLGSAAQETAIQRGAQAMAGDADTVASLGVSLGAPDVPDLAARRRAIHDSLALFDEHSWGASDPWADQDEGPRSGRRQWAWKAARALDANDRASDLLDAALQRLGSRMAASPVALASLAVVNTAGRARTDVVTAFVPDAVVPAGLAIAVLDGRTGARLPADESPPANADHRDAGRVLRVVVPDVPAVGWVRLDLVEAAGGTGSSGPAPAPDPTRASNGALTVTVDLERACLGSIVEARTGRELVSDASAFGFGAVIHDRYAAAGLFNHASSRLEATERLELLGSRSLGDGAVVRRRASTACGEVIELEHRLDGLRSVRTTLTLPPGAAHLDLEVRLAKDATTAKESTYVAFPFRMRDPVARLDVTGGIVGSGIPAIPGSAPHARAVRDWISLEEDGLAVAWATRDVPLVHLGGLPLPYAPYPPTIDPEPGLIVSWVHNNVWDTNFPAQQGFERSFRFRIAAAPAERSGTGPVLAREAAAGLHHPLLAVVTRGGRGAVGTAAARSLLEVEDPAVTLEGVVSAGPGTLLIRLRSLADATVTTGVRVGLPVAGARRATWLGIAGSDITVRDDTPVIELAPRATAALLVRLEEITA